MRLRDRVALITGGTAGIGAATAELFAEEGAKVVVTGRDQSRGERFVAAMQEKGHEILFLRSDASKSADVQAALRTTMERFGKLNIVFANAGFEHSANHEECPEEEWDVIINNDLKSAFLIAKYAPREMRKSGEPGAIIIMSSMVASIAGGFAAAFIPAQAGKEGMVRNLAVECAPYNIRVNGIAPGSTATDSLMRFYESWHGIEHGIKWSSERHPIGRIGQPREIAYGVLFLASDDASYITGHILRVEGGFCIR